MFRLGSILAKAPPVPLPIPGRLLSPSLSLFLCSSFQLFPPVGGGGRPRRRRRQPFSREKPGRGRGEAAARRQAGHQDQDETGERRKGASRKKGHRAEGGLCTTLQQTAGGNTRKKWRETIANWPTGRHRGILVDSNRPRLCRGEKRRLNMETGKSSFLSTLFPPLLSFPSSFSCIVLVIFPCGTNVMGKSLKPNDLQDYSLIGIKMIRD